MNSKLTQEINEWLKKADEDLLAADQLNSQQVILITIICFHCQQAIEKYLKAFLLSNNVELNKTHNIELLCKNASVFDQKFSAFNFGNLTDFAVKFRYPADFPEPEITEVANYIEVSHKICSIVKTSILN